MLMHPLQQTDKKMDKQLTHLITRMTEFQKQLHTMTKAKSFLLDRRIIIKTLKQNNRKLEINLNTDLKRVNISCLKIFVLDG